MAVGSRLDGQGAGRDLVAADITIGAGFGTTPILDLASGSNDSRGRITVTADATPSQATATVAVAFTKAYDEVPVVVVSRDRSDEAGGPADTVSFIVTAVDETGFTVISDTLPVDTEDTGFSYIVVG